MLLNGNTCAHCRFFRARAESKPGELGAITIGACHRYPPQNTALMPEIKLTGPDDEPLTVRFAGFPVVSHMMVCGEFKA